MAETDFIGRGWSFPPDFDAGSGTVTMTGGAADIDGSLHILLSTAIGERVMQPQYGCNLSRFVFEPATTAMLFRIRKIVEDAILYFEPRIRLDGVTLVPDNPGGRVEITVRYTIKTTHARGSFVFPFYLADTRQSASAPAVPAAGPAPAG